MQDAGVSNDRLVYHHPISQPLTTSDGSRSKYITSHTTERSYDILGRELTNLSNEYLGCVRVAGILKQISYEIQVSYVCK